MSGARLSVYVATNASASTRFGSITISGSADADASQTLVVSQLGNEYNGASLASLADAQLSVASTSSTATSSASESPFTNSYDGNTSTFWHISYGSGLALPNGGSVTATWNLGSGKRVDYITYVPRQDSNPNGNIGVFTLLYSTNGRTYTNYGTYDFGFSSSPSTISLGSGVTAQYGIQIVELLF